MPLLVPGISLIWGRFHARRFHAAVLVMCCCLWSTHGMSQTRRVNWKTQVEKLPNIYIQLHVEHDEDRTT